ncbi:MAG: undecaprenyldiphospho-muramoylpentapeptide beta-N-acetylglucosaminyltransferase [Clostridiaceae bacterium]|nr:undecaprenyldiphospho-muramoylpentapeptide beta-N-acetylglucosaminyltransferase [Clostridiaceae bacterium]
MKIIFAGGGTAGHINPAIAIASYICARHKDCDILFIGTKEGMENKLVPREGYNIRYINIKGFRRKLSFENFIVIKELFKGIMQARSIIRQFKPDIVVGTGGYVSGPVVWNASLMKIPTLIHEQNVFPGVTTKILSHFADVVAISFDESRKYLKTNKKIVLTGNPIRQTIIDTDRHTARMRLGLNYNPFILVFGGSLGADKINSTLIEYIKKIRNDKSVQLMFGTGERYYKSVLDTLNRQGIDVSKLEHIRVLPYIHDMDNAMAAADLVVCRAGAITLSEITAMGKPALLIPSPNVTNNHQEYNARALEKQGAAIVIREQELNGEVLYDKIHGLLKDRRALNNMGKNSYSMGITNATEKIYNIIAELIKK